MTTPNRSASALAQAYMGAKTAKAKQAIADEVAARASVSKRLRWGRLADAIANGDELRIAAYAATGEAKSQAWAAVKAAEKPAAKAKPAPKRKAKPAAKAKANASAPDLSALTATLAGVDDAALAAFFNAVMAARK